MRTITRIESDLIAGGMVPGPGEGGYGGDGGGGTGGGSGGSGDGTSEAEFENAMEAIIQLGEQGVLDTGTSKLIFESLNWANMAADVNSTVFQQGMHDYTTYETSGIDEHDPPGYIEIVNWSHVNWHAYDENGTATPQEAMKNLLHDIQVNHHMALDPNTTGLNESSGGGGSGGGDAGSNPDIGDYDNPGSIYWQDLFRDYYGSVYVGDPIVGEYYERYYPS